jgi:hypothetical protein
MMRVYVAGPMSHIPQFNFPYFDHVANTLRKSGYDVVSPAELDDPEFRAKVLSEGITGYESHLLGAWGDCLARDVKLIADSGIKAIVLLPGWQRSRGARLEAFVGVLCDLKFALYRDGGDLEWFTKESVVRWIARSFDHVAI